MILEQSEIIEIINGECPDFIKEARKKQKVLDVHVNSRGVDAYLMQIETFENEDQYKLRKKFAISNKFVIANLMRPVDKVFTARGGSELYNVGGLEKTQRELKDRLSNVRFGMSIRKWIANVQSNKYYSDPAGLVFFENKDGETWPTLKSIQKIKNYHANGRSVEWICFEGEKRKDETGKESSGEYVRFVDDAFDYMYYKDGDKITLISEEVYENPWKKIPAIVNSDIINDQLKYSDSPLDVIVELADKYMRTNSIKTIHEYLHGFPFFWMYQQKCKSCKGVGSIKNEVCRECNGTGAKVKRDVSDALLLATPSHKESPTITPDVAGYIVPPHEIPAEQREELMWMWTMMNFTLWGKSYEEQTNKTETATAALLNVQPESDRVSQFSTAFEDMEQKMTDFIGQFYLQEAYNGCSISYGRRYIMEPPDKVWEKYSKAKEKGAPASTLNHLLIQYYQAEFMNDAQMLAVMLKGMKVEPFVHLKHTDIKGFVNDVVLKQKMYFNEWWKTLNDDYILTTNEEKLKNELINYAEQFDDPQQIQEP